MLYSVIELAELGVKAHHTAKVSRFAYFYGVKNIEIGENVRIDHGCLLMGDIVFGRNIHVAPYCLFYGKAGIRVGDYSNFSAMSVIHTESDDLSGRSLCGPQVSDSYKPNLHAAPVSIGKNVVLAVKSTILPGVMLHDGCAIGAHSLVKDDCEPDWIYGGVPAKKLKRRHKDMWHLMRNHQLLIEP